MTSIYVSGSAWSFASLASQQIGSIPAIVLIVGETFAAVLHQSKVGLVKALSKRPISINETNKLRQTPLHIAVGWPDGVRILLDTGAHQDAVDVYECTPLAYAVHFSCTETVKLLENANCSFSWGWGHTENILFKAFNFGLHEVQVAAIDLVAKRRRNLKKQILELSKEKNLDLEFLQDDRVIDEHAAVAEELLAGHGGVVLEVSSLLKGLATVYHVANLTLERVQMLWQAGFRDIGCEDMHRRTPLWQQAVRICYKFHYNAYLETRQKAKDICRQKLEVLSWFANKDPNLIWSAKGLCWQKSSSIPTGYALAVAGARAMSLALCSRGKISRLYERMERLLLKQFNLSTEPNSPQHSVQLFDYKTSDPQFLKDQNPALLWCTVFSSTLHDKCKCACYSGGCIALTLMLKEIKKQIQRNLGYKNIKCCGGRTIRQVIRATCDDEVPARFLVKVAGHSPDWDFLASEIIRFRTFEELELRHTCCRLINPPYEEPKVGAPEAEEIAELKDEDSENISLLESLVQEFEKKRGEEDLVSFLQGYWATRMKEIRSKQGGVDEERLREMGVVLKGDGSESEDRGEDSGKDWGEDSDEDSDEDSVTDSDDYSDYNSDA
ncbi:MAG: hypothetical protein Q9190_006131 [Brigantiaea leucoxantha]